MMRAMFVFAAAMVVANVFGSVEPKLLPLPPGAVEPRGWLRDWCLTARAGYIGHMDEVDPAFPLAWTEEYAATRASIYAWNKGAWPLEGGGYWFDGLVRLGYCLHDEALIAYARRRLAPAVAHAAPGKCLFLWWLKRDPKILADISKPEHGWLVWASGLLSRPLLAEYEASRDPKILEALRVVYGSDTDSLIQTTWSFSNPTALYWTWRYTRDPAVAKALDAVCDDAHSKLRPELDRYRRPPDLTPGSVTENAHGVQVIESSTPWAWMYLYTGRRQYLDAALGWHELVNRLSMQPNGAPAMDEFYQPTGSACGSETCVVAAYLWSQLALFSVTGDGTFADRAERDFFNAGPGTVTRDFNRHVYQQPPNRIAAGPDQWNYARKHAPLCCTAALNRTLPYYVTSMWMATPDGGYEAVCHGPAALNTDKITVECQTDYPFGERLVYTVTPKTAGEIPLTFRVPGWCTGATLTLNGQPCRAFRVSRAWKPGDTLVLTLPMTPVLARGFDRGSCIPFTGVPHNSAQPRALPKPGDCSGEPYATVSYGPLLFALGLPEAGGDPNKLAPGAQWQYALDVKNPGLTLTRAAMPAKWDWPLAAPVRIEANAVPIPDWKPAALAFLRLPPKPVACGPATPRVRLSLIPYGCAKLRISMFPVAE